MKWEVLEIFMVFVLTERWDIRLLKELWKSKRRGSKLTRPVPLLTAFSISDRGYEPE
jgi:hypothetical protein